MIRDRCKYCQRNVPGSGDCSRSPTGKHVTDSIYIPDSDLPPADPDRDNWIVVVVGTIASLVGGLILERAHPAFVYAWIPCSVIGGTLCFVYRRSLRKLFFSLVVIGIWIVAFEVLFAMNPDLLALVKQIWGMVYQVLFKR